MASEGKEQKYFYHLCNLRAYQQKPIRPELVSWIDFSITSGCFHLIRDSFDKLSGYIIWARISKESLRTMIRQKAWPKYAHEWNEGNIIVILDIVNRSLKPAGLQTLLRTLFGRYRIVLYEHRGKVVCLTRSGKRYNTAWVYPQQACSGTRLSSQS